MTLNTFLKKHPIDLQPQTLTACREALDIMSKSRDNLHDHQHVESMLGSLDKFMSQSREISWKKIDFDVLLLSICWHDVWKSTRIVSGKVKAVYHTVAEGLGSMRLFSRLTKKYHFDKNISQQVRYAIRKHSMVQILPAHKHNLEVKILMDLDKLDLWKPARIRNGLVKYKNSGIINPGIVKLFLFFFKYRMLPQSRKANFQWTIDQMQSGKNDFLLVAKDMIADLVGPRAAHDFLLLDKPASPGRFHRIRTTLGRLFS